MASLVADYGSSSDTESDSDSEKPHILRQNEEIVNGLFGMKESADDDDNTKEKEKASSDLGPVLENPFRSSTASISDSSSKLPSPVLGNSTEKTSLHITAVAPLTGALSSTISTSSVFANPYREAEEAKQSVLEKHVKMTPNSENQNLINGRQVCWNYRKGRCRFGHNCKFAHDSDLPKTQTNCNNNNNPSTPVPPNHLHTPGKPVYITPASETIEDTEKAPEDVVARKKKKRPGLSKTLTPSKKVMKQFNRQQQEERPWLATK